MRDRPRKRPLRWPIPEINPNFLYSRTYSVGFEGLCRVFLALPETVGAFALVEDVGLELAAVRLVVRHSVA